MNPFLIWLRISLRGIKLINVARYLTVSLQGLVLTNRAPIRLKMYFKYILSSKFYIAFLVNGIPKVNR